MTQGKEPFNNAQGIVQRAAQDALAQAIVAPTSHEVSDLIGEAAGGKVKIFGELRQVGDRSFIPSVSAQRTDIEVGNGLVSVHRGLNNAEGIFASARRLSQIEVKKGTDTHSLTVKVDPTTSPTNPLYRFLDGEEYLGSGYGQRIDLALASQLLEEQIPEGRYDHVPIEVVQWVKGKLA